MSKFFTKHMCWFCFGIFVEHKLMYFAYIFRKDTFTRKKVGQEEKKGSEKRKKHCIKALDKDKILFLFNNNALKRWCRCMTKSI